MSKLLRAALCSAENLEEEITIPEELKDDAELLEAAGQTQAIGDEIAEASAALESLFDANFLLHALREGDAYTEHSAAVLTTMYGNVLSKTGGVSLESLSHEGYSVALEGKIIDAIRNGFDTYFQRIVLHQKHQNDIVADFFKSVNSQILKYDKALDKTEKEYNEKKHKFREGDHHATLVELWYFFSNIHGQSRNIISDLEVDTEASEYMLHQYPKAVLAAMHNLTRAIGHARLDGEKGVAAFLSEVEKLPSIEKMFNSHFLGDGYLFNVTSVERKIDSAKRPVNMGGKTFSHLAELAAPAVVVEKKSGKHTFKKAISQGIIGQILSEHEREDFVLTTDEIGKIIEYGQKYVSNLKAYFGMKREIESAGRDLMSALERMKRGAAYNGPGVHEGLKQVFDYLNNLNKAIKSPASDEVVRSVKGAKYCNYLALRMIYNASKYF